MEAKAPYHHGALRRALHDAALRLIAEHGADAFTMKQAATEAGVSVAAPYRHYAGKAELLGELAAEGFDLLTDRLRAAGTAADPAEALLDLGTAYLEFAQDHPAHFEVMFSGRGREPRTAEETPRSQCCAGPWNDSKPKAACGCEPTPRSAPPGRWSTGSRSCATAACVPSPQTTPPRCARKSWNRCCGAACCAEADRQWSQRRCTERG
ncbi:hypothetical protein GCM10029992_52350 [Glycomyces albus]